MLPAAPPAARGEGAPFLLDCTRCHCRFATLLAPLWPVVYSPSHAAPSVSALARRRHCAMPPLCNM